jgi:DNA polymerase III subunit beta
MNLIFSPSDIVSFRDAVSRAVRVSAPRTTIPVLMCLHLQQITGGLVISSTNLDAWYRESISLAGGGDGAVCCFAKALLGVLSKLPEGQSLQIEVNRDSRLEFRCGGFALSMAGLDPSDFPDLSHGIPEDGAQVLSVERPGETLLPFLKDAVRFASTDETRWVINGVHMLLRSGKPLRLQATDGRRAADYQLGFDCGEEMEGNLILHPLAAVHAVSFFGAQEQMEMSWGGGNFLLMRSESRSYAVKLIDGAFPNVDLVIPSKWEYSINLDPATLMAGIERVGLALGRENQSITMEFRPGKLTLRASSPENQSSEEYEIGGDANSSAAFNPEFLLDALRTCGTSSRWHLGEDGLSPVLVTTEPGAEAKIRHVLMQMRMQ